jgi:hypothetical protein
MTVHELVEQLRIQLSLSASEVFIVIEQKHLRLLLDALEIDEEHRHLLAMTHAMGTYKGV